jgi:hypothetical protein
MKIWFYIKWGKEILQCPGNLLVKLRQRHSLKSKHHKIMMKQQGNLEILLNSSYSHTMLQYIFNHSLYTSLFHDHPIITPMYRRRQNSCKKLQTFLMINCFLLYKYHQPYSSDPFKQKSVNFPHLLGMYRPFKFPQFPFSCKLRTMTRLPIPWTD